MDIRELLKRNLTEYESIPFWSWNDELQPEELRRQIRLMKQAGIGGFFMHARRGGVCHRLREEELLRGGHTEPGHREKIHRRDP